MQTCSRRTRLATTVLVRLLLCWLPRLAVLRIWLISDMSVSLSTAWFHSFTDSTQTNEQKPHMIRGVRIAISVLAVRASLDSIPSSSAVAR